METVSFLTMAVSLFAITGTIAIIPIFVAATNGQTGAQQRETALIAAATYTTAAVLVLFVGNAILGFFGISVAALRVAGMAIVAVIVWKMMNAPTPSAHVMSGDDSSMGDSTHHLHVASNTKIAKIAPAGSNEIPTPSGVGIMPLGFPIYGGPGVLSVVIAWGTGAKPVYMAALIAILINAALIIILDFLAIPITRLVGAQGLLATEKVFGLIVVAIAVSGMTGALLVLFPGLAGGVH